VAPRYFDAAPVYLNLETFGCADGEFCFACRMIERERSAKDCVETRDSVCAGIHRGGETNPLGPAVARQKSKVRIADATPADRRACRAGDSNNQNRSMPGFQNRTLLNRR
jgi:hypothetical protein